MRYGMKWVALATVLLVSTGAWAVPDTETGLLFNMNFEAYNNGGAAPTTTSAKPAPPNALVGTVVDFNVACPNVFGELSRAGLGRDANVAELHDLSSGAAWQNNAPSPNDLKIEVPNTGGIFDLGLAAAKHTWTFWWNSPSITDFTFIRHSTTHPESYPNDMWEIRLHGGKLHFYHKNNSLRMETAGLLSDLGLEPNEWHSGAIVIDRSNCFETSTPTKQLSAKIYFDGVEVPIIVTSLNDATMNVDIWYDSPLWLGAGERQSDGLIDDMRFYNRVLTPLEISWLNQPDATVARAYYPIPQSEDVIIGTTLTWEPVAGASQEVFFGTDPCALTSVGSGVGLNTVSNVAIGGPLNFNTVYYWLVNTNGTDGPLWSFTSETGKAINPSPADGQEDVSNYDVNLIWATPTAAKYAVYVSTIRSLVENNDISVREANGITDPCIMHFDPCSIGGRGEVYYWRVNCTYTTPAVTIPGDIWTFRTDPYDLVFNTANYSVMYADREIPALGCVDGNGWTAVPGVTSSLDGNYMTDGNVIAVFNFPGPNGFNYDKRYDIIVVPDIRATEIDFNTYPTPLSIRATGSFYFDGRIQIAGDDVLIQSDTIYARSGGFPGPKWNQNTSVFSNRTPPVPVADYWTTYTFPNDSHGRFDIYNSSSSAHPILEPTALCRKTFGPGQPINPPYKGGGGGGSGGRGGETGRGYFYNIETSGPSYGDEEVPVPFGGSAGGWGSYLSGAAGGGGIEIIATGGNVTLDANSRIIAKGGSQSGRQDYPSGGGGGGSVRIIASGSVTLNGSINVNGGNGGDSSLGSTPPDNDNDTGGGGGGGRVAIFYGSGTAPDTSKITRAGGAHGTDTQGNALAKNGESGTLYVASGAPNSAKKASAPTPKDGDPMVYCNPDPCNNFQLKWYSGYGGTNDVVKCDTFSPPSTVRATVPATRGQHTITLPFNVASGTPYYWKVETDGVSSDTWSFKTVKWYCPLAGGTAPHVGGPDWDFNHDCVLDIQDLAYFAEDWLNSGFGTDMLTFFDFAGYYDNLPVNSYPYGGFGIEWRQCINRSDGCVGF